MRIRKSGKFSKIILRAHEHFQAYECHVNQSPWDVIPFSQENYLQFLHQYQRGSKFGENGTSSVSIRAVDRKNDHRGWSCSKKRKEGRKPCEHHLTLLKSYNNSNKSVNNNDSGPPKLTKPSNKKSKKVVTKACKYRAKATKKNQSSSSDKYEFVFYSGFGPQWSKKRRLESKSESQDIENGATIANVASTSRSTMPFFTASPIGNVEVDYYIDGDAEEQQNENGKSEVQKPMKEKCMKC